MEWALITILVLAGWGTGMWGSFEHVKNECLRHNAVIIDVGAQGPLQQCEKE